MRRGWRTAGLAAALLAAALLAGPAAGETVIAGKSAQAVRCAAYIGMAAQYGHVDGIVSVEDRNLMTWWSVLVLDRWVPLAPEARMAAYRRVIDELGSRDQSLALIARHTDWCLREFKPAL